AGLPAPSLTCVNDSVTDVSVALATVRSVTVPGALGVGEAAVVAVATFERAPKAATPLSVPLNATSWKPYAVERARPSTVQDSVSPIAVPASGVAQVPCTTLGAPPQPTVSV